MGTRKGEEGWDRGSALHGYSLTQVSHLGLGQPFLIAKDIHGKQCQVLTGIWENRPRPSTLYISCVPLLGIISQFLNSWLYDSNLNPYLWCHWTWYFSYIFFCSPSCYAKYTFSTSTRRLLLVLPEEACFLPAAQFPTQYP